MFWHVVASVDGGDPQQFAVDSATRAGALAKVERNELKDQGGSLCITIEETQYGVLPLTGLDEPAKAEEDE